jgi:hypothetical protein
MIFVTPLQPGTTLANVRYAWITNGVYGTPASTGITQPTATFAIFRIDTGAVAPTGAEELVVYDSTDTVNNWVLADYKAYVTQLNNATQILLTAPYTPSSGPSTIIPGSPPALSICRCYGTWTDISALSVDGVPMTLTLVAVDNVDSTLIYDLSSTTLKNTETQLLISDRVVTLMLMAGQLQNVNGDAFVDLNRTDYISGIPTGTHLQYLLTCDSLGAPMSMALLTAESPITFTPVVFKLDTSTIGLSSGGTFDLSKKAVT